MKKVIILCVILLILIGCNENTDSNLKEHGDNEIDVLEKYLNLDDAEVLLSNTWSPIIEYMNLSNQNEVTLDDFKTISILCTDEYNANLFDILTQKNNVGEIEFKNNIWLPTINDEEVEITNIEIIPNEKFNLGFELVITEEGQFKEITYGHKRLNHYLIDNEGNIKLYITSGSLGKLEL